MRSLSNGIGDTVGWRLPVTILVTGGAGYIGSHGTHALHDSGENIFVLDADRAIRLY